MLGYLTSDHALIAAFAPRALRRTRHESTALNRVFKTAPKLADYFRDGEILSLKGVLDRPISGLAIDSRRVVPGNLFFALPGRRIDGASFIDEAMSRGAVAVVTERMPAHPPAKVTFIHVAHARAALAWVAQRYFGSPDRDLAVAVVTGGSGKTTVAHLLKHFLQSDQKVGLIGSINYDLGSRTVPSFCTTPESLDTYGMMAQMREAGCRQAVLELDSRGIVQGRALGLRMGAAVFTNLARDGRATGASLDAGLEPIAGLFAGSLGSAPGAAVVNLDDPSGARLLERIPAPVRRVTFGEHSSAQVRAEQIEYGFKKTSFKLVWPEGTMAIDSPLIGRGNLSNLLAAVAAAWSMGRDPFVFLARMRAFKGVPGRMERIDEGLPFNVVVDLAHTEEALRQSLATLRALTTGRLLVVFGCAGQGDRAKRAGRVATVQEFADFAVATSDNPRSEALAQIFADMRPGASAPERITWIEDRRRAINLALAACKPGDCLLVSGKGHEGYQRLADTVVPFDDRVVIRELIGLKARVA